MRRLTQKEADHFQLSRSDIAAMYGFDPQLIDSLSNSEHNWLLANTMVNPEYCIVLLKPGERVICPLTAEDTAAYLSTGHYCPPMKNQRMLEEVQVYLRELEIDSVISRSHITLQKLHSKYGAKLIGDIIRLHFLRGETL